MKPGTKWWHFWKPSSDAKWWHFWNPSSGIGGGLVFGIVLGLVGMVVHFVIEGNW